LRLYAAQSRLYAAHSRMYAAQSQLYGAQSQLYGAQLRLYGAQSRLYVAFLRPYKVFRPTFRFNASDQNEKLVRKLSVRGAATSMLEPTAALTKITSSKRLSTLSAKSTCLFNL
jgi:hypothetical protein